MNWPSVDTALTDFENAVVSGLSMLNKTIPSKFLYDERGSRLFDQICRVDEYYVTRTEAAIMRDNIAEIAQAIGGGAALVELGSGSSSKTRLLLNEAKNLSVYVPLDISAEFLRLSVVRLRREFSKLNIVPCVADFSEQLCLPDSIHDQRIVFYFPGSTIGNLSTRQSVRLLEQMATLASQQTNNNGQGAARPCGLLIGIDLEKAPHVIDAAYNDAQGVTAAFSKNLLVRINRELNGTFDIDQFDHQAAYDPRRRCVDIGLVSRCEQEVSVAGHRFSFDEAELIGTETAKKYRVEDFCEMAAEAGFVLRQGWTDERDYFAVLYFETEA